MSPVPANATEQRKLAAIMFTDMVGYSALAQRDEALALRLLDEHQILLRPFFPKFNGREVETIGDAFLVEFTSALDAVRCAIAIQKALAERNASSPGTAKIQIRIGVHVGDVVQREKNVLGDCVNIAARIEPLAKPGGICVTQQVFDQIHNKLEMPLLKLGTPELKNIQVPVCLYRVVLPGETKDLSFRERARFKWRLGKRREAITAVAALLLIAVALSSWRRPLPGRIESLAVLPLTDLSNDPTQAYFADGITELLTTELGTISTLNVISSQAFLRPEIRSNSPSKLLAGLNVDAWVEGSIVRDGPRVAITARLIQAATRRQLWGTTIRRDLSNIVDLQGEVALALAEAMKAKLLPEERAQLSTSRPVHPEAVDYYLQGKFVFGERIDEAIAMLEKAIRIDPMFARAHAQLAHAYASKGNFIDPSFTQRAHQELNTAIQLDPSLPEIYFVRGRLRWSRAEQWNVAGAFADYREALKLNPSFDEVYYSRGVIYWHVGLADKALPELESALKLNPSHPNARFLIGQCYMTQANYPRALSYLTNSPSALPVPVIENSCAMTFQSMGRTNEAWSVLNRFLKSGRPDTGGLMSSLRAVLLADAGDRSQALESIAQAQVKETNFGHFHHTTYNIATAYALLNDPEQAIKWLRQTADDGYPAYGHFERDPNLVALRSHPEFIRFMAELEKRWKHFNETL